MRNLFANHPWSRWLRLTIPFTIAFSFCAAGSSAAQNAPQPLKLIARVDHLDTLAREPMIARHPDGSIFVSGYGSQVTGTDWTAPPPLWRTQDLGQTWKRIGVGSSKQGAQGNSDVDLVVAPDGTLFLLAMGFNRESGKGTHIAMGVSPNAGSSWQWHRLSTTELDDRPWIAVAPDGTAHAIWNDGSGVSHVISTDAGRSWMERPRIHAAGGSSHLATGADGQVAVRISPISGSGNQFDEGVDLIAISTDGGDSWKKVAAPGNLNWNSTTGENGAIPRWVEPLAWGPEQALYALWSEGSSVNLGITQDLGDSWNIVKIAEDAGMAFFPYLVSDLQGRLAATWFVSTEEKLTTHLAHIDLRSAQPVIRRAAPFAALAWLENTEQPVPTPAGEYVPVIFLGSGQLAVVTPVQDSHNDRWGFTWWQFSL